MMNRMMFAVVVAIAGMLVGCTASYEVKNIGGQGSNIKLDPSVGVYVAVPEDGQYDSKPAGGSGQIVAQAVSAAFGKRAAHIHVADKFEPRDAVLASARQVGAGYAVIPTIASWEQRATEWSGRPSRLMIRLTIIDVKSGEQLAMTSIVGRSRIMSLTSTSPESLLQDPLEKYAASLY